MTKQWKFAVVAALVLGLFAALSIVLTPGEVAVPRGYQCDVYTEQGCAKYVVASGGELEVRSGGILDVQSGATLTLDSVTVSGPLTFGSAASVVTGTTIAHGLATTPTSVLLSASGVVTTHPLVLSTDATSITVGFITDDDPPAMTVYWIAGK